MRRDAWVLVSGQFVSLAGGNVASMAFGSAAPAGGMAAFNASPRSPATGRAACSACRSAAAGA